MVNTPAMSDMPGEVAKLQIPVAWEKVCLPEGRETQKKVVARNVPSSKRLQAMEKHWF